MALISIPVNELTAFDLPKICVMTGATENVQFRPVKFQWYPPWVNVFIIVNVLVFGIVAQITMKRAKGELPFSDEAWNRWRKWKLAAGLLALGVLVGIVGGAVLMAQELVGLGAALMFGSVVGLIVGLVKSRGAGPQAASIKDNMLMLKVPLDSVAQSYQSHLKGGAVRQAAPAVSVS